MENKKQLVIVPPMSEPFQKLNEVLHGIAGDENIEISIIDDPKELTQFMGSSGQSLVVFSNAKKCATFLQENRFVLAKTHSKVILLTPKEIPAKTLIKFVKVGLTESILENSPPKTLLYKVKLLLRSIKTASQQENKDQVIKSVLDNAPAAAKPEVSLDKVQSEEASANYLGEERSKFKTDQNENAIDYGEALKGKTTSQEEAIETHWKGKRKQHAATEQDESAAQKRDDGDSSEIDMYYRGKNKNDDQLNEVEDDLYGKKIERSEKAEEDEASRKNKSQDTLDAEAEPKTRKKYQEDETDLFLKPRQEALIIEATDVPPKPQKKVTEEDKAENLKKELEELDALFAEAKKRQTAQQEEDLGGHLKGKILNNTEDDEELPEIKEKREYDNSELNRKEKSFDLDLIAAEEEKNGPRDNEEEDEEKAPHEGDVDKIDTNMVGENGSTDKINTRMMSEINEDGAEKIRTIDVFDLDPKNKNADDEEDASKEKKNKLSLVENVEKDKEPKKRQEDLENDTDKERPINLKLEAEIVEKTKNKTKSEELDKDGNKRNSTQLPLSDGDDDHNKSEYKEADPHMAFRKLDQIDLDLDEDHEGKKNHGKVDKLDTYYRGGKSKKQEHSWDNLDNKNRDVNIHPEKGQRNKDEFASWQLNKDNGEITIDYRKLKEEFNQISHGEQSPIEDGERDQHSQNLLDSEDEGTFKVVELDARGFDFGINIINLIYQKDSKPQDFYKIIAEELITNYKGYPLFYTYKSSDKKHIETFDSFMHFSTSFVSDELKEWWFNTKSQNELMADYFSKSMATWLCREIEDKSGANGKYWEDVELPQWAANELTTKKVELIFPYFDGVDRMGLAIVLFPEGFKPKMEKGLTITLEMIRTILLDSIQRKSAPIERDKSNEDETVEKKNILSMFSGLFNRNKAG